MKDIFLDPEDKELLLGTQDAMLKAVPNKNVGLIILLTSIFTFLFFREIRNLTTLCLLNNGFSVFFLSQEVKSIGKNAREADPGLIQRTKK